MLQPHERLGREVVHVLRIAHASAGQAIPAAFGRASPPDATERSRALMLSKSLASIGSEVQSATKAELEGAGTLVALSRPWSNPIARPHQTTGKSPRLEESRGGIMKRAVRSSIVVG